MKRSARVSALLLVLVACGGGANREPAAGAPPRPVGEREIAEPAAPWAQPKIASTDIEGPFATQWKRAENRAQCAPIGPARLGEGEGATPRAAAFSGGWAVAYDLPGRRGVFGIAGTGMTREQGTYAEWPHRIEWADGSSAEYGPEGGVGPNQLAYLRIAGQDCLYNVWSRLGRKHLEFLLANLRFVDPTR